MDRICTVTTLKAPFEETLRFVFYHLSIGVERVILFFDDPTDPAADALQAIDQVACVRCDRAYWEVAGLPENPAIEERQDYNASQGFALAREGGYDWVIHIDSDELLYAQHGLRETLTRVDPPEISVRFAVLESVLDRYHYTSPFLEIDTFRIGNLRHMRIRMRVAKILGCHTAFHNGHFFRAHTYGKSAVRTNAKIKALGIHSPWMPDGSRYSSPIVPGLYVLHYDACGLDAFRSKWRKRMDGTAIAARMGEKGNRQLEAFARSCNDEEQILHLYEQMYFISKRERYILRALGLLRTVSLEIPEVPSWCIPINMQYGAAR